MNKLSSLLLLCMQPLTGTRDGNRCVQIHYFSTHPTITTSSTDPTITTSSTHPTITTSSTHPTITTSSTHSTIIISFTHPTITIFSIHPTITTSSNHLTRQLSFTHTRLKCQMSTVSRIFLNTSWHRKAERLINTKSIAPIAPSTACNSMGVLCFHVFK